MDKQFGPYRLVRQIATGGMAEIYLAKTRGIGGFEKYVALKLIHPNFSEDEHFIEMLIDEAKISVQLQHVNIAQIFDLGRVGNTYYITMEFIDGTDLFRLLRTVSEADKDFEIGTACYIAKEVCAGLDYAHRRRDDMGEPMGIVHRDVSPQNVLISYAGEVKIVDFGIAKAALRARQTAVGVIKGKYYYMSPEQAWGDPVNLRTDIFSAGILLYEMLTGQMLYLEDNINRLLDMVRKAEIPPPSSRRRSIPPELDAIVMKALRKKAADRYATAQEFQIALERFIYTSAPNFSTTRIASFVLDAIGAPKPKGLDSADSAPHPIPQAPAAPAPAAPAAPAAPRPRLPSMQTAAVPEFVDGEETTGALEADMLARSREDFRDENSMIFRMSNQEVLPEHQRGPRELTAAAGPLEDFPSESTQISAPPSFAREHEGARRGMPEVTTGETAVDPLSRLVPGGQRLDDLDPPTLDLPGQVRPGGRALAAAAAPAAAAPAAKPRQPAPLASPERARRPATDRQVLSPRPPAPVPVAAVAEEPRFMVKRRRAAEEVITGEVADDEPTRIDAKPIVQTPAPAPAPPAAPPPPPVYQPQPSPRMPTARPPTAPPSRAPSPPPAPFMIPGPLPHDAPTPRPLSQIDFGPVETRPPGSVPLVDLGAGRLGPHGRTQVELLNPNPPHELPAATPNGLPHPVSDPYSGAIPGMAPKFQTYSLEVDEMPAAYRIPRSAPTSRRKIAIALLILSIAGGVLLGVLFLRPKGPTTATMLIQSSPPGARVILDGKALAERTPLTLTGLSRGRSYHLVMELDRFERWDNDQEITAQQNGVRVVASLTAITGTLKVTTIPPGASVTVNGLNQGNSPITTTIPTQPAPFAFDPQNPLPDLIIEVALDGYKTERRVLPWEGRRTLEVSLPLEPKSR